ncbi:jerky protein homolog-like [Bombus impatiens]|uniref:Jerky protein homolog-like n=1 Tax=Bombus impatiens TaxID=132113 RepID=A0A6P3V3E3_BOMIM|nr:jerky protein homolog-like [Bombus impatiens]
MTSRRKPLYLTITDKYTGITMRGKGKIRQTIMEKYGIPKSTLINICIKSEVISNQCGILMGFTRKRSEIERAIYHWYLRCKERKVKMTGVDIQNEAREINHKLNGHPNFKASSTWLRNFKERYCITTKDIREYFEPAIPFIEGHNFKADFNRLLEEGGFTLKNVYNVAYTIVMWKAVSDETCILNHAKSTRNLKMCDGYVTALFCANATGCHKLPVLIIGNVPETHSLYKFKTEAFTTIYISNTSACMDSTIFKQWYKEHFLKSIEGRQRENGYEGKYLLLLDNTTLLHDINDINNIDPLVEVTSPPPNVSPHNQPMNCGVITCFKRKYRIELLKAIKPLSIYNTEVEVIDLHKELSIWDCCRIVHDAWSHVEDSILISSWHSLLYSMDTWYIEFVEKDDIDAYKTVEFLHKLPGCEQCQKINVLHWFYIDTEYDVIHKVCADEVVREFEKNTLGPVSIGEAGSTRAKLSRRS